MLLSRPSEAPSFTTVFVASTGQDGAGVRIFMQVLIVIVHVLDLCLRKERIGWQDKRADDRMNKGVREQTDEQTKGST